MYPICKYFVRTTVLWNSTSVYLVKFVICILVSLKLEWFNLSCQILLQTGIVQFCDNLRWFSFSAVQFCYDLNYGVSRMVQFCWNQNSGIKIWAYHITYIADHIVTYIVDHIITESCIYYMYTKIKFHITLPGHILTLWSKWFRL
jgi:hypothetical protein